jgi:AraC-like DNA-binding protein
MLERHDLATATTASEAGERSVLAALPMAQLVFGLSQGIAPERLCETAGLSLAQLTDRDRFVPHDWKCALWDALGKLCGDLPVGIAFGKFITPDHLGYVGQVFRNARHGLDALQKLSRFGSLFDSHASRYPARIQTDGDTIRVMGSGYFEDTRLECVEATMFGLITQLQALAEAPVRVLEVHCHVTDQRHRAAWEEFFACPIRFGSEQDGMVFAREPMLAPLRGANTAAAARIEAYVAETYASSEDESVEARLHAIVQEQLRAGTFSQRSAARALGLGVRALERRLSKRGTSFGQIVEDTRRSEAVRLLKETDAAVYEIAFCLGYQDVSSFNRAFKRWYGAAPREYRARGPLAPI